jgi:hypothetical protein
LFVKVRVVDHEVGRYVELRWEILSDKASRESSVEPKALPALPWATDTTEVERQTIARSLRELREGDPKASEAAAVALAGFGHKALAAIVNQMAECDLRTADGAAAAQRCDRLLQQLTLGLSAGYVSHWDEASQARFAATNAEAVRIWRALALRYSTDAAWQELLAGRRARGHR